MFEFGDVSRFRSELMGLGIMGVMLAHALLWLKLPISNLLLLSRPFTGLVFTEGFLLLSGFGLFYSWQKCSDCRLFYKKRLFRIFFPYLILSFPFILFSALSSSSTAWEAIARLLSLKFWIWGNDSMWYISVSIVLYALFPIFYKILFGNTRYFILKCCLLIALFISLCWTLFSLFPKYYEALELGLPKMWMFIVGMIVGKLSYSKMSVSRNAFLAYIIIFVFAILTNISTETFVKPFGDCLLRLVTIPIVCVGLTVTCKWNGPVKKVLSWLGKYSLELYILHLLMFESIKLSYAYFDNVSFISYCRVGAVVSISVALLFCSPIHERISKLLKI